MAIGTGRSTPRVTSMTIWASARLSPTSVAAQTNAAHASRLCNTLLNIPLGSLPTLPAYTSGRNMTSRLRSNSEDILGLGNGDDLSTAASMDLTTASSPLH